MVPEAQNGDDWAKVILLCFCVKAKQKKKIAVMVHVLWTTKNLVISRWFASKEMYQEIHVRSHCSAHYTFSLVTFVLP